MAVENRMKLVSKFSNEKKSSRDSICHKNNRYFFTYL